LRFFIAIALLATWISLLCTCNYAPYEDVCCIRARQLARFAKKILELLEAPRAQIFVVCCLLRPLCTSRANSSREEKGSEEQELAEKGRSTI
jgi:hypothetical protein